MATPRAAHPAYPHGVLHRLARLTPAYVAVALLALSMLLRGTQSTAAGTHSPSAPALDRPLPSPEAIAQGLLDQAALDRSNKLAFLAAYHYVTVRHRDVQNLAGVVKESSDTRVVHDPARSGPGTLMELNDIEVDGPPRDRSYQERDFQVTRELIDRFDFLPLSWESADHRTLCKIAFRPRSSRLPERKFVDRFVNQTAGLIWLDATDYALVRAHLWLADEVSFGAGILGKVYSLESWMERRQTPDGLWYTQSVRWQVDYRQFLVRRVVRFHETLEDVRRVPSPAYASAPPPHHRRWQLPVPRLARIRLPTPLPVRSR